MSQYEKHKWTDAEDNALVAALLELYNKGTLNADNGFKPGYLTALEQAIHVVIPDAGIKSKPHIESRLRTMKKDFCVVYDMVYGSCSSGFGWDSVHKCVVAENAVWDEYVKSHKRAARFRNKRLEHFDALCTVFGKDRANGGYAQDPAEIVDEATRERNDQTTTDYNNPTVDWFSDMEMSSHGPYIPVFSNAEMSASATEMAGSHANMSHFDIADVTPGKEEKGTPTEGTSLGKKRKRSSDESHVILALREVAKTFGTEIQKATHELSQAMGTDKLLVEERKQFFTELQSLEGLADEEKEEAALKLGSDTTRVEYFFCLAPNARAGYVKRIISRD